MGSDSYNALKWRPTFSSSSIKFIKVLGWYEFLVCLVEVILFSYLISYFGSIRPLDVDFEISPTAHFILKYVLHHLDVI